MPAIVGLLDRVPLTAGDRDLDNYLFPVAQRLGPRRAAAMFGRKTHGASWPAPRLPRAWWRDRMVLAGPVRGPGEQVRGVCAGQFTAERVKTRMAAAV